MDVADFIEGLCLGELSNLYIGLEGQVELHPQNKAKLIHYMNQGLTALHSRFALRKKELIIVGMERKAVYILDQTYSMTNGKGKFKYIDDTCCEPFQNDLVKIMDVHNEVGIKFLMNVQNNNNSVHTVSWNTLQIPHPVEGQPYFVMYQAKCPKIEADGTGCEDVSLPPTLEEALASFVCAKVYSHMNGEANKLTAQENMANFESKCLEVETNDLGGQSEIYEQTKSEVRGWC
jgi:hypothetical protein